MSQNPRRLKPRPCIICGTPTLDREGQYKHPRCSEWLPCALRRNQQRARPKPVSKIVAEAMRTGTLSSELEWAVRRLERARADAEVQSKGRAQ